jgi:hypothetical protein
MSPHLSERRGSPRLSGIDNVVRLDWQAPSRRQSSTGRLRNASQTGALVSTDKLPPIDQCLLIRLEEPVRTDWCMAKVVRYSRHNEVGLRFIGLAADAFVLAATLGIDLEKSLIGLADDQRFSHTGDSAEG